MPNMDLNTFYQHALQWQHQREEAERQAAIEQAENIKKEWKLIADAIRKALPIEGMTIFETVYGQFAEMPMPNRFYSVDCQVDPNRREQMRCPEDQRDSMCGVIRVAVIQDTIEEQPQWRVNHYGVWVNGQYTRFDYPEPAFLAAFEGLQVK